jgi:hypothetical protein
LKEREVASADFAAMEATHTFAIRDHPESALDWDKFPDLGELVAEEVKGRTRADQRTLFLNSTGIGCQFTALAHYITTQVRERSLGMACVRADSQIIKENTDQPGHRTYLSPVNCRQSSG